MGFGDLSSRFGLSGSVRLGSSWNAPATLERITRPFKERNWDLPPPVRVPKIIESDEDIEEEFATLTFGRAGRYFTDMPDNDPVEDMNSDGYGYAVNWELEGGSGWNNNVEGSEYREIEPGDECKPKRRPPQDKVPGIRSYDEIDRQVRRIKVYDPEPDDPSDPAWVIVEQIISMRLRGPDGVIAKFNLKPPPPPPKPAGAA